MLIFSTLSLFIWRGRRAPNYDSFRSFCARFFNAELSRFLAPSLTFCRMGVCCIETRNYDRIKIDNTRRVYRLSFLYHSCLVMKFNLLTVYIDIDGFTKTPFTEIPIKNNAYCTMICIIIHSEVIFKIFHRKQFSKYVLPIKYLYSRPDCFFNIKIKIITKIKIIFKWMRNFP